VKKQNNALKTRQPLKVDWKRHEKRSQPLQVDSAMARRPLRECVRHALDKYFAHLDGHDTRGLHRLFMEEVETPLLEAVLAQTAGNQSRAAEVLGINRGTLRKKLKEYGLD